MQLGDHPGVVLTQGPTAVDQHPKHRELLVVHDRSQAAIRVPTNATECASVASVLRPWPVAKTRARADSFGGTSITCSPAASSRTATWWPPEPHGRTPRVTVLVNPAPARITEHSRQAQETGPIQAQRDAELP